jgi:two-component system, NtrC family, sensor histidine kinase HydH
MDIFTLAATSFIIALSLLLTGKKDELQEAFAVLCSAIFVSQIGVFFQNIFAPAFWLSIEHAGALAIPPLALWFFRQLTRNKSFLSGREIIFCALISLFGILSLFTPISQWIYFHLAVIAYTCIIILYCYIALLSHVKKLPPSTEKKRLSYLVFGCLLALIICSIDLSSYLGINLPKIAGLILSALLYLILLVIAYPQLNELHDFFARALIIFISTLTGTIIFYFVALFFSNSVPSFTSILMTSFLIVISLTPAKMILKNLFSFFYPDSKDVFTSLYEFDEKLEREKALMLAEMAPVFAHEIRNPLGSIKGAAQYLKSEASTEEQQELFNVIIEGTNRLNAVVSQFLDYARPYNLNFKSQNINTIIRKAISIIAANRLAEKITIAQELSEDLPEIEVDEQQLMQVILNIALNAIESMPQGGSLIFRTSKMETSAGETISISIRDTGSGISKEEIKNIFKPFFTTKERGVGLGLAICQKIIKEHGGHIRVESIPSQGSIFFISLNAAE